MTLQNKVLRYITEYNLIKQGDRILLALSGGPDSVCLFYLLKALQVRLKFTLFASHFNHGLRPSSEKDSDFCQKLCAKYRIPFLSEKGSLKPGTSEDASRKARYDFLKRAAQDFSCHSVATGHQLDDQAETVLLRLIRGTGLQGLSGIAPCRPIVSGCRINLIRPMLSANRAEISQFLKEKNYRFVTDETNLSPKFQRNRIRLELLPLMEECNPGVKEVIFRTAEILSADYRYISEQAAAFLKSRCFSYISPPPWRGRMKVGGRVQQIPLKEFSGLPLSLQREVLRQALSNLMETHYRVNYQEIEYLRRFFLSGRSQKTRLSGNLKASRSKDFCKLTQTH